MPSFVEPTASSAPIGASPLIVSTPASAIQDLQEKRKKYDEIMNGVQGQIQRVSQMIKTSDTETRHSGPPKPPEPLKPYGAN